MAQSSAQPKPAIFVGGAHAQIPVDPGAGYPRPTLAAGAVIWRGVIDDPEIAVVHRPHYDDWSLPKGKVDPGEALATTAEREIREETGLNVRLGKLLGHVAYPVGQRTKVVYYWMAQSTGGQFSANDEVDELRWLRPAQAMELLTYQADRQVIGAAAERLAQAPTTRVLLVRHARAHQRRTWSGDDDLRPLDKKGRRQAEMLVPQLLPYQPTAIFSAQPLRCQHTAAPLAAELGLDVVVDERLGDSAAESRPEDLVHTFDSIVACGGVPVIVSQGLAIPTLFEHLDPDFLQVERSTLKVKKSSVWVLSFNNGTLTAMDYLASPLPVR